eukprot:Phypoly_transcript_18347.p1 GENE.Phypoly_transcript_18347~~Phypoly_transcript_18347.p1  ORF type:complete len:147 (+),score=22.31 Phypoly_transcript_18347:68-442(+)
MASKGALALGNYYDRSYVAALIHLFPEMKLEKHKFTEMRNLKFRQISDRRKYLEALAESRGMDPLIPETWYKLAREEAIMKSLTPLLNYYRDKFGHMILHLFPNIGVDKTKFFKQKKKELTNLR